MPEQEKHQNTAQETAEQPKKEHSKFSKTIYWILLILLLLIAIVSGALFLKSYMDKQKNVNDNEELVSIVEEKTTEGTTYPSEPADVLPQYREVYQINSDLVGWIKVDNTRVNHPVAQTSDNQFYLSRDFKTKKRPARGGRGTVFMDYRNNAKELDKNTILYGHNALDGTMFSDLEKYKDMEFYKQTPVIDFDTIYKEYKWKVFAVFYGTAEPQLDNDYVFNFIYPFMTDENFADYVKEVQKRSFYHTDVEVLPTDKILTLVTCTRDLDYVTKHDNVRLVILARLVREGESETVDVSKVKKNPNPKHPQLWYDKHKQENPYINDEKWYPKGVAS